MKTLIGWDTQDITPDRPVELIGQYYQRISQGVRDSLTVTAFAIEQLGTEQVEQCVLVTLDIVYIAKDFLAEVRQCVGGHAPGLNPDKIILNATHIHSGPAWYVAFRWWTPAAGVMSPAEVRAFILARVVQAIANAWKGRKPAGTSAATAVTPTGYCRRAIYADGSATMYGNVAREDFRGMESENDPTVRMIFTWNAQNQLTGVIVNVACPAQVMEAGYLLSADYFGELRKRIHAAYGQNVHLLAQVGAAGCQSPRNLPVQSRDETNYWREAGVIALADRLEKALAEGYARARDTIDQSPVLKHSVSTLQLPIRHVQQEEYLEAKREVDKLAKSHPDIQTASKEYYRRFVDATHSAERTQRLGPFDDKELEFVRLENALAVVQRFNAQDNMPGFAMELHAIRIGECAIVTNPFELFLDYGQMIQARSRAEHTFVVQLAGDAGRYLPTARAVAAGGYSALIINGSVGPEGGTLLVEASVEAIGQLWTAESTNNGSLHP
jgi:hypothetical protein